MAQAGTLSQTIGGYFSDHTQAARALEALKEAGFSSAHLGAAYHAGTPFAGSATGTTSTDLQTHEHADGEGVWGKIKGFFTGTEAEPYADERTQGAMATRDVTANPADISSYDDDNFHHNLAGLNVPEERSRYLSGKLNGGDQGAVVTVMADDRAEEAESILTRFGADLGADSFRGLESEPEAERDLGTSTLSGGYDTTRTGEDTPQNIQLLGEVLRVHKERVSRGEMRLRKETITEMQTIQVPVTREELVIERHAGSGQAVAGTIGASQDIRIPLSEEQASLDKSTVVREEVSVGKREVADTRDLSSEVRHEDLIVDDETTGNSTRNR